MRNGPAIVISVAPTIPAAAIATWSRYGRRNATVRRRTPRLKRYRVMLPALYTRRVAPCRDAAPRGTSRFPGSPLPGGGTKSRRLLEREQSPIPRRAGEQLRVRALLGDASG